MARMKAEGVPTIEHLPRIECDPAAIRAAEPVAMRVMVVSLLAVHAEPNGMPRDVLEKYLDARCLRNELTPKERAFLAIPSPTEHDRGPFTWQYESAHVLLWALGYVPALGAPTTYCTARGVSAIVAPRTVGQLIEGARMRTADEIFDESDLIFRYHWAARNATLNRQPLPAGLLPPVCHYRHYALNWLTHRDWNWDDVDTST